jgi:hypothetical protein
MTDETRDPCTDEAGTGSDEARLLTPGGPPGDLRMAPGSSNRSEETVDAGEESDEGDVEGVEKEEEEETEEDLDEDEDLGEDEDDDDDEEDEA